jgi:hypothetical protein
MRRIVSARLQATGGGQKPDGFFDRIIKYIPADIVAGWVALDGLSAGLATGVLWGLFVIVAVFAYFWTLRQTEVPGQPPAVRQSLIAAASFAVWAFALHSGPFRAMTYPEAYGSIALIVYTLGIGLVVPKE